MIQYREFLFVLSPGEEITNDTFNEKSESKSIVGTFDAMGSKPHITVRHIPKRNRRLVIAYLDNLDWILKSIPPIELSTDGYDFFKENNTMYTKIILDDYVKRWFKSLQIKMVGERKIVPHITIAKTLSTGAFELLWPIYQYRKYKKRFLVDHMTVLERNPSGRKFTIVRKIYFGRGNKTLNIYPTLFDIAA